MAKIVGLTFPKKEYACPVCGKRFKSEAGLKRHMAEHDANTGDSNAGTTNTEE